MSNLISLPCPKCDGRGHLTWASHYANGVCFCCKGVGQVEVDVDKKRAELSADTIRKADWVMRATPADYAKLSYRQLLAIHTFTCCGWGLQEAYPEMRERFHANGWSAFMAAQERQLAGTA